MEHIVDAPGHGAAVFRTAHESVELRPKFLGEREHSSESIEQLTGMLACPIQEVHRESAGTAAVDIIQAVFQFVGHYIGRIIAGVQHGMHPTIQCISGELAFQHRCRIKEDVRRIHRASKHVLWPLVEIRIVFLGVGHCQDQGVAVASPCAAGTLDVLSLGRRNRRENHRGEVSDIDAHLQSRRAGEHVHVTGLAVLAFEFLFDLGSVIAVKQSRVLGSVDALRRLPAV